MENSIRAREYMSDDPQTVTPESNIYQAIHIIIDNKLSGLTVVDTKGKVVGIISEVDCLRAILDGSYYGEAGGTVAEYMTANVQSVSAEMAVVDIAKLMLEKKRRRMPVTDELGTFIGQISIRSILKAILKLESRNQKPS